MQTYRCYTSVQLIYLALKVVHGNFQLNICLYVCTLQIEISRESNEISFGLTLNKEISEDELGKTIVIDTIVVDSPAYSAGVMAKDVLVAIDGQKMESLKQAAKMIKNKSRYM